MPLIVEFRHGASPWRQLGRTLTAAMPPGSMEHIGSDGRRELIIFKCQGEKSTISIAHPGSVGILLPGRARGIFSTEPDTIVATLADGEDFEMPVRSVSGNIYVTRWRHAG